jgi:hypothetical protein
MPKMSTPLQLAAEKRLQPHYDVEYYLEVLRQYPEDEWFTPNNQNDPSFDVCRQLAYINVIAVTECPIWVENSFRGVRYKFKYNEQMDY